MRCLFFLLFAISAFVAEPSPASEKNCAPLQLDLRRVGPLRNQGISGLCFAFEAADLASYAVGERVSALDLALFYFQESKFHRMADVYKAGGDTSVTLKAAAKRGFCAESDLPSDEDHVDFSGAPHARIHDALLLLDKSPWSGRGALEAAVEVFPRISVSDFENAARLSASKQRILELRDRNCSVRFPVRELRFVYLSAEKHPLKTLFVALDRELERENLVGLGIHSNDLYAEEDEDDAHAVTVVGRRWNGRKGTCEYLLRDNFGEQCSLYKKSFDCRRGYIWVGEGFLRKNLMEVEYVRN